MSLFFGEKREEPAAPAANAPESQPAAAPAPVAPVPAAPALRAEPLALAPDMQLDPTHGLVEFDLGEPGSIVVDGSPMGRFATRRVMLTPGAHHVEVETDQGRSALDLDVPRGLALRVAPVGGARPRASAASSAE
jgi:hypothetical protein